MTATLLLLGLPLAIDPVDWPMLTQAPYEKLKTPDIGLRPLLTSSDGKPIATPAEWAAARKSLIDAWKKHLGPPPQRPKTLDTKSEREEKFIGYRRQLVSFTAEGDDRIRAWLLIPDGLKRDDKFPAIVVFHQTTRDTLNEPVGLGKGADLAIALHLAKRGYVTLSPECYILKDPKGWASGQAAALAKRRPGWTGMGKMTFDASRCVDFLESLPQVDATRIGCIGHSLGAKETLYAMAFEPRYKVGIFSEGGLGLRMSNWFAAWYLAETMKAHVPAFENHQVLALAAPRPLLVIAGDDADGDESWAFIKAARPVYQLLGAGDRIGLFNHHQKHTFPAEAQRTAYRWLDDGFGVKRK